MQLYFPICVNNHWFVFVLDIKDHKFVFLNSLYPKGHEFQEIARDYLVRYIHLYPCFQLSLCCVGEWTVYHFSVLIQLLF